MKKTLFIIAIIIFTFSTVNAGRYIVEREGNFLYFEDTGIDNFIVKFYRLSNGESVKVSENSWVHININEIITIDIHYSSSWNTAYIHLSNNQWIRMTAIGNEECEKLKDLLSQKLN